jgi:hypothetical protein
MSDEFKAVRITLSDEAFARLEEITKMASFRNYSSAIEECIRVVSEITADIYVVLGKKDDPPKLFNSAEAELGFTTIATRMWRITGRRVVSK